MADRGKSLETLPEAVSANSSARILIVEDPSSAANVKTISTSNLFGNTTPVVTIKGLITANTLLLEEKSTPANSTPTISQGAIFFDDNYIYVATADNTLKRVALTTF